MADGDTIWMSHGDSIMTMPPGFMALAHSENSPYAAIRNESGTIYGVQFHPEVHHTPKGKVVLKNFLYKICKAKGLFSTASFIEMTTQMIRDEVGEGKVVCALSGGVDSSVVATLVHRAIGDRLTCVFVNNGVLRKNEGAGSARSVQGPAAPEPALRRRVREVPRRAEGRQGPGEKAKDHRKALHQGLRGRGARPRRRAVSRPGDTLSRRHRKRFVQRALPRRSKATTTSAASPNG